MDIPLIQRRRLEAETLAAVYNEMLRLQGERAALDLITRTVSAMGFNAGRAYAAQAPNGPSMEHFRTMLDVWQRGGALDIRNIRGGGRLLAFEVHGCAYVDLYRSMDLPPPLVPVLSCLRDAPFVRGYSPKLEFSRCKTIGEGGDYCDFQFQWRA